MGANFITATIKATNPDKLKKAFDKMVEQDKWEYGHGGYTGTFAEVPGIMVVPDPFPSRKWTKKKKNDVYDYLCDTCLKWENARAIKTPGGYFVAAWASS